LAVVFFLFVFFTGRRDDLFRAIVSSSLGLLGHPLVPKVPARAGTGDR
jgi:hypothetical protein